MSDECRRNPFKHEGRVNLPPFSECLQSLGSPDSFKGFGESLSAASPVSRNRPGGSKGTGSSRCELVDCSYLTMEISELTSPGTPPPQVERYCHYCATAQSDTTVSVAGEGVEETSGDISVTLTQLPPLFPNVSPIERSPSVNPGVSVPRTEPQEVCGARTMAGSVACGDLKVVEVPEVGAETDGHCRPLSSHSTPCLDYIPSYEELLLEDCGDVGTWCKVCMRCVDQAVALQRSLSAPCATLRHISTLSERCAIEETNVSAALVSPRSPLPRVVALFPSFIASSSPASWPQQLRRVTKPPPATVCAAPKTADTNKNTPAADNAALRDRLGAAELQISLLDNASKLSLERYSMLDERNTLLNQQLMQAHDEIRRLRVENEQLRDLIGKKDAVRRRTTR